MISKRELKKIAREFRLYGSRLLSTKYGNGMSDLNRFLNFIESHEIILSFIEKNSNEKLDMKNICESRGWNEKFQLPIEKSKEIGFLYQLLKYGQENYKDFHAFSNGYGSGNKIQDHIDAFNNEVTKHFVDYIREYLEDLIIDMDEDVENHSAEKKIFISYSWLNKDIADLIDRDFRDKGFDLTRDERDLKYKDSIKKFMQQIGKHDHVIMLISDSYLKSENCMYEVMEVMRNREYKEKILMIMLKDTDKKHYKNSSERLFNDEEFKNMTIEADVYSANGRIGYIQYWEAKERDLKSKVASIQDDINKIQPLNELKRINNITRDIGEFLEELSDWKGLTLKELKNSDYNAIISEIKKI